MIKLTHKHVDAISHAELFLKPALSRNPEPRFQTDIERDLQRLDEVKRILRHLLLNPQLPYPEHRMSVDIDVPPGGKPNGSTNG